MNTLPPTSRPRRAPHTVSGYHGCSRATAAQILAGEPFLPSTRSYDWLGEGVYFWEYGPFRAREWAQRRFGSAAAVLEATIRLGRTLNFLDVEHLDELRGAYEVATAQTATTVSLIPINTDDGRHHRDRWVIELYCGLHVLRGNRPFQTVRGCFPEGEPVYPGSKILSKAHVQIAVRDPGCIERVRLVG